MVKFLTSKNPELFMMAIAFPCGSINEPPHLSGISHLLEHMMFRSKTNSNSLKINEFFLKNGIKYNAVTSSDYTIFYIGCHESNAYIASNFFLKLIKTLDISKSEFQKEKKVVIEEFFLYPDDEYKNDIYYLLFKNTPYYSSVIGNKKTINNITIEDLQTYHQIHYNKGCPHIIAITNKSKETTLCNIIKKYGFFKECQHNPTIFGMNERIMTKENRLVHYSDGENGTLAYIGYPASDSRKYAAILAAYILQMEVGRELREKRGNIYHIKIDYEQLMHTGVFLIKLISHSLTIPDMLLFLKQGIQKITKIQPNQFNFYKNAFIKNKTFMDNTQSFNLLLHFTKHSLYHSNIDNINFEMVNIDDFSLVCKTLFKKEKAAFKFSTKSSYRVCLENVL